MVFGDPMEAYIRGIETGINIARRPATRDERAMLEQIVKAVRHRFGKHNLVVTQLQASQGHRGRRPGSKAQRPWAKERVLFIWVLRRIVVHNLSVKAACEWLVDRGVPMSRSTIERRYRATSRTFSKALGDARGPNCFALEELQRISLALNIEKFRNDGVSGADLGLSGDELAIYENHPSPLPPDPPRRTKARVN